MPPHPHRLPLWLYKARRSPRGPCVVPAVLVEPEAALHHGDVTQMKPKNSEVGPGTLKGFRPDWVWGSFNIICIPESEMSVSDQSRDLNNVPFKLSKMCGVNLSRLPMHLAQAHILAVYQLCYSLLLRDIHRLKGSLVCRLLTVNTHSVGTDDPGMHRQPCASLPSPGKCFNMCGSL